MSLIHGGLAMRHPIIALALTSTLVVGAGCMQGPTTSQTQWGAMNDSGDSQTSFLVNVPPGGTIGVCSSDPSVVDIAIRATLLWAKPIGRLVGPATLNMVPNCNTERHIKLTMGSNGPCGGDAAGCSSGNEIFINSNDLSNPVYLHVLIHEIGHQWGMCDQYDIQRTANCAISGPRGADPDSIMAVANGKTKLTADDIEGIIFLADLHPTMRYPTPVNDQWKQAGARADTSVEPYSPLDSTAGLGSMNQNPGNAFQSPMIPSFPTSNNAGNNTDDDLDYE
jgi:hypothetical protein